MSTVYKIRRSDGMFSMGGSFPRFNKTGKIWKQPGHLTNHLNQLWRRKDDHYDDCEIVEYEIVEREVSKITIQGYLQERKLRLEKQKRQQELLREAREKKERFAQYEQLKKEFG